MTTIALLTGALCVWRITHLVHTEDGPWDVLRQFREALGHGVLARAVACFYCLSLWVALPIALVLGAELREQLLLWPALSGAAILLERVTTPVTPPAVAPYVEDAFDEKPERTS